MLADLFASILAFFVIDPFTAEITERLGAVRAPAAIVAQVEACATTAAPALIDRALNDWWWATETVVSVGLGMTSASGVLADAAPSCASLVADLAALEQAGEA